MAYFGRIDATVALPMKYFGSVPYYALMGRYRHVIIDDTARYDKRKKDTHRMDIADTHGVKSLTVPVSRPDNVSGTLHWSDIAISRHGQWWHVVAETLASAYGRTPFFEFYIDRLRPFFAVTTPDEYPDVATLCRAVDRAVRAILGFDNIVEYKSEITPTPSVETTYAPILSSSAELSPAPVGMHHGASAKKTTITAPTPTTSATTPVISAPTPAVSEYYQIRSDRFGFIPNLSILDLIFNLGPESPLILH